MTLKKTLLRPFKDFYYRRIILYDLQITAQTLIQYLLQNRKFEAINSLKGGFYDTNSGNSIDGIKNTKIIKRICSSFKKAKKQQEKVTTPYQVGKQWQGDLDRYYKDLISNLLNCNLDNLKNFFSDFKRNHFWLPEWSPDYYLMNLKYFYKYYYINTWYKYFEIYEHAGKNPSLLHDPSCGNPTGMKFEDRVVSIETIRAFYYADEIMTLLNEAKEPVVCEIGGGLGGQAYAILKHASRPVKYIYIDIPEVLAVASYFLMATFPDKKIYTYSDKEFTEDDFENNDILLLPNFMLPKLNNNSVDLFYNSRSFPEMNRITVLEYLKQIERICKKYLLHINNNGKFKSSDDQSHVNLPGNEVRPSPKIFRKVLQYPSPFTRPSEALSYNEYYVYLYEKLNKNNLQ